jgi:hypothetical protein
MSYSDHQSPARKGIGLRGEHPRVLFVNDLWGYGTVTMAMAVAEELEGRATRLFAGKGPGFELARQGCFEELMMADTMAHPIPPDLDQAVAESDAVLTVMNGPVAHRAAELRIPCVYLDCMLWLWPAPPDVPPAVSYFAESFPGAESKLERWRVHLHEGSMVGPLITHPTRKRSDSADAVLISFGGLFCPLLDQDTLAAYAETMARCALTALDGRKGRVIVAAGRHVLDRMDADALRSIRPGVELADLGHDAYLAELRRSRVLISSAGIHALYEACAMGVPCVCLPAQNLGQVIALEALEREGAGSALDWDHLYGPTGLDREDEPGACRDISALIQRFQGDAVAQAVLGGHLADALAGDRLALLQREQARFYQAQGRGKGGAPLIADRVLQLLESEAPAPVAVS